MAFPNHETKFQPGNPGGPGRPRSAKRQLREFMSRYRVNVDGVGEVEAFEAIFRNLVNIATVRQEKANADVGFGIMEHHDGFKPGAPPPPKEAKQAGTVEEAWQTASDIAATVVDEETEQDSST